MNKSLLESTQVETAPDPTVSIIWMHGLGADGSDFVPIVRELDLTGCPPIRFVFPHAPSMPVTVNNGYDMPAWYDILGIDLVQREDEKGLRASQAAIEMLIAQEKERGIAVDRIVLAGFSQGCAMAIQTGLRHPEKLAGLLCLSGYVPIHTTVQSERHDANQHTPIFMAHGRYDQVIPIDRAEKSRDLLQMLGYKVEWHEYPMEHTVCAEEVGHISAWLRAVLT
jgi:phospholipase/carboxylesterase